MLELIGLDGGHLLALVQLDGVLLADVAQLGLPRLVQTDQLRFLKCTATINNANSGLDTAFHAVKKYVTSSSK